MLEQTPGKDSTSPPAPAPAADPRQPAQRRFARRIDCSAQPDRDDGEATRQRRGKRSRSRGGWNDAEPEAPRD